MRLIDADALTELCDIMADKCDGIGESVWHQFRTTVEWSPTVDAVPVIRCKECEHYKYSATGNRKMCFRKDIDGFSVCYDFEPNDFCPYAEREDNEG